MMSPQEVANRTFSKATLGGYNMAMVDSFLDQLTEDYTALYNDSAILKNKLKVLSDTVEEYRATDDAMRKTLLAAQKMADAMVADAEARKTELVHDAEEAAQQRIQQLKAEIATEEYRLQVARESTAAYVAELTRLFEGQREFLAGLNSLTAQAVRVENTTNDIESAMSHLNQMDKPVQPVPPVKPIPESEPIPSIPELEPVQPTTVPAEPTQDSAPHVCTAQPNPMDASPVATTDPERIPTPPQQQPLLPQTNAVLANANGSANRIGVGHTSVSRILSKLQNAAGSAPEQNPATASKPPETVSEETMEFQPSAVRQVTAPNRIPTTAARFEDLQFGKDYEIT